MRLKGLKVSTSIKGVNGSRGRHMNRRREKLGATRLVKQGSFENSWKVRVPFSALEKGAGGRWGN